MIGSCRVHDFPCHESISQFSSVFIHFLHFSVTGFWRVHEREPFDSYFTKSSNWWSPSNWKRCVSQKFHLTFIPFFSSFLRRQILNRCSFGTYNAVYLPPSSNFRWLKYYQTFHFNQLKGLFSIFADFLHLFFVTLSLSLGEWSWKSERAFLVKNHCLVFILLHWFLSLSPDKIWDFECWPLKPLWRFDWHHFAFPQFVFSPY